MLTNSDISSLNKIKNMCIDLEYNGKNIEEFYDDVLKELLVIRGYNSEKVYEFIGCGELINVIDEYGKNSISEEMNRINE